MSAEDQNGEEFRRLMPVTRDWAYFDHAAVAPLSKPAADAISAWMREATEQGDTVWSQWTARVEQIRASVASMTGADSREITFVTNTTSGISLVAEGFPWREGDNVVTMANEFPSNIYPWMNLADRGVETRLVQPGGDAVDVNRISEACDEQTRIISISWVGYASGWRIDVEQVAQIAHDRGALLFLDAIQGLGVFPLDVRRTGVDFLAADGHKWMLGPEGAGVFYTRREHLDLLRPLGVGWNSVVQGHDFGRIELKLREQAARYEGGSMNIAGTHALGASLDMLAGFGLSSTASLVADRVLQITDLAIERLQQIGATVFVAEETAHRSGIVTFDFPGRSLSELRRKCLAGGVAVNLRGGRMRISPHAYNNEEDVDRLIKMLSC